MPLAGDSVSSATVNPANVKPMPLPPHENRAGESTTAMRDDISASKKDRRLRVRSYRAVHLRYDAASIEQDAMDQPFLPKLSREVILFFLVALAVAGVAWALTY